jgi:predicted glycoside hydrolase/deacetylase ChbG (UPF0249 family)
MIIITADDYGKTRQATDGILRCFSSRRVTSASAMVFMEDSQRAAPLALETGLETGLHINLTMPFSSDRAAPNVRRHHGRVAAYLAINKLTQVVYNPLLAGSFDYLFKAQRDEFVLLYGKEPGFYNGHHHMHLCANMLMGRIMPKGARVRRTFTFDPGERLFFNLFYRALLDRAVDQRYVSTDYFFSLSPRQDHERLRGIFHRALSRQVEMEVHPENADEREFLCGDPFVTLMGSSRLGGFRELSGRSRRS